jgi:hypothetical protein
MMLAYNIYGASEGRKEERRRESRRIGSSYDIYVLQAKEIL